MAAQQCEGRATIRHHQGLQVNYRRAAAPIGGRWTKVECVAPGLAPQSGQWMAISTDPGPTWIVVHWWTL